jgi:hypothetical protein
MDGLLGYKWRTIVSRIPMSNPGVPRSEFAAATFYEVVGTQ